MLAMSLSDLEKLEPGELLSFRRSLWIVKIGKAAAARGARSRAHETHFTMQFDVSAIDPRCVSAAQAEKNLEWFFYNGPNRTS
jgi:hypothetical protein